MQPTTTFAQHRLDLLVERTLTVSACGVPLVGRGGGRLIVPTGQLPVWPPSWRPIPGSDAASDTERFSAYTTPEGYIATVQSTTGPDLALAGRLIALVSLGGHRLSVLDAGEGRFLARWSCGEMTHQLTAGPTTLATFMELVLNVRWSLGPS